MRKFILNVCAACMGLNLWLMYDYGVNQRDYGQVAWHVFLYAVNVCTIRSLWEEK